MEAVELVAATEGFFKLAVEPLDEPPIRKDEPRMKHKCFSIPIYLQNSVISCNRSLDCIDPIQLVPTVCLKVVKRVWV